MGREISGSKGNEPLFFNLLFDFISWELSEFKPNRCALIIIVVNLYYSRCTKTMLVGRHSYVSPLRNCPLVRQLRGARTPSAVATTGHCSSRASTPARLTRSASRSRARRRSQRARRLTKARPTRVRVEWPQHSQLPARSPLTRSCSPSTRRSAVAGCSGCTTLSWRQRKGSHCIWLLLR